MLPIIKNHLENAFEAISTNRFRTVITLIGLIVGVAGITVILTLSKSAEKSLDQQITQTISNAAIIKSGPKQSASDLMLGIENSTNTLTEKDSDDIARIPNTLSAPLAIMHTNLKSVDEKIDAQNSTIIGSSGSIKTIAGLELQNGQFIDEANGAVISRQLAIDLFGTENAIGNILYIREEPIPIIGTIKNTDQQKDGLGVDFNNSALLPLEVIKKFTQNTAQIQQIVISAENKSDLDSGLAEADKILQKNHKGDNDYQILTQQDIAKSSNDFAKSTSGTIAIIAGVSLLMGGIGIMNIMLVNVAERQREVGIRKAVGASNQQIVNQFLTESAIIGLLGGVLGYGIGILASLVAAMNLPFSLVIEWPVAAITIASSMVLSIIFGIYPAIKAAKQNPIDLLKF